MIATSLITYLPLIVYGYATFTICVDRFSIYLHFLSSRATGSATYFAEFSFPRDFLALWATKVYRSDLHSKFIPKFWQHPTKLCNIRLRLSPSLHPQTEGPSEAIYKMIENFLWCYCAHNQKYWDELLVSAEFSYNSEKLESSGRSPFEINSGWSPKSALDFFNNRTDDI